MFTIAFLLFLYQNETVWFELRLRVEDGTLSTSRNITLIRTNEKKKFANIALFLIFFSLFIRHSVCLFSIGKYVYEDILNNGCTVFHTSRLKTKKQNL